MTFVDLPDGWRSIEGRVRQKGEADLSLLPVAMSVPFVRY